MRFDKCIALMLALCLLLGGASGAVSEELVASEGVESVVKGADSAGEDTGLMVEGEEGEEALPVDTEEAAPENPAWSAPEGIYYARANAKGVPVCCDTVTANLVATLKKGEVVLLTGSYGEFATVTVNVNGTLVNGFMDPAALDILTDEEVAAYQDEVATGEVALYNGDVNLPLGKLSKGSLKGSAVVSNANYTEYSNDTVFTLNGKEIYANMVPDAGIGNCWKWAQGIYKLVWGVNFNSEFVGSGAKGINMLRNLSDDERLLTPEHLKTFVQYAVPGATLRVSSCTSDCSQFENDGLSCGHKGHSLIIVERRADGVVTMDDHSGSQHTRFYSWEGFCKSWKNYDHVKYIKWPNAPALPSTETVGGYEVRAVSETYRVRATASRGARVYTAPENGSVSATLAYPAIFAAAKRSTKTFGGYTWVYGKTQSNVSGWLPLNEDVANVNDAIPVTGASMGQAQLILVAGKSASLTVNIQPADATNKQVAWKSSDEAVATVSGGTVTAVSEGTVTVTATTEDGGKKAACEVRVVPAEGTKTLGSTGGNGTVKMLIGQRVQLVPKFATDRGWKVKGAKSSNASCASIDSAGVVTANAAGTATITVVTQNKKSATVTIQVFDPYKPTSVKLNKKGTINMKVGGSGRLACTVTPATAVTTLTWKSSNESVATVDSDGVVTAVGKGTCYVGVITDNGKYAKVRIKVS